MDLHPSHKEKLENPNDCNRQLSNGWEVAAFPTSELRLKFDPLNEEWSDNFYLSSLAKTA